MALTLKTLCGLSVEEIARAFLVAPADDGAAARARQGQDPRRPHPLRGAGQRPAGRAPGRRAARRLPRLQRGLRRDLGRRARARASCAREAIRLGRLLRDAAARGERGRGPARPHAAARLAPRRARRRGRASASRSRSRTARSGTARQIAEGQALAEEALRRGGAGFYALQAAIAALHAHAARAEDTDWPQIAALYALLLRLHPSPVVALNHAAAVAMGERLERGLRLIERLEAAGELSAYHLLPAAKADILRRLGRPAEAAAAYRASARARHAWTPSAATWSAGCAR